MSQATLESLWHGVESAAPDNPGPLVVAAGWCEEHGDLELAYALTWCAGKCHRPFKRGDVKRMPWQWIREQRGLTTLYLTPREYRERKQAILPRPIFDMAKHPYHAVDFSTSIRGYRWLARYLADLRPVVEVPRIVLPPQPEIVATGPVSCAACGLLRAREVTNCPVCKSGEVTGQ